ncbi:MULTISPECIES: DNA polymerase IV [unclassified Cryobacterium]|uniref:DNA polymerase IV n=1 Tax=unclassified Cryobacterium TaxID=2649013 RepID=UPI002AB34122|nr:MULTISPECIES: DNA polymerase IV [unclassified Cryobacterium]MDY7528075.1 DNA polymerase IV [Cryobacterium sp. 10C2]MDY7556172.1 DNA polymerase IV [Cryobacterium sp. 10C3]MEB0004395.1 DNA polymerase IV [Cryobacterium sp. RTC2.1]MEB0200458.1 DNA polymerase IV [Cryobacterium sp. 5I3]MEB0290029.1 DNA polymerase IV [Cryobacterium sp. 10C2]
MSRQDGSDRTVSAASVDDSSATLLHIDMDAFFASVELLDHPELVDKPVIVGHRSGRSVVTAANYVARRYGVNSAMPMALALRRCPAAVVLEPHMSRYRDFSEQVMGIFTDMTPLVEPLSIDEAFLDVSGARRLHGSPAVIAALIRERVQNETGLTCSVGAASTKFVAKMASSRAKPNGLLVVPAEDTLVFLHPLPVGSLWGVGAMTEKSLLGLGLRTIGDLAATPLAVLQKSIGEASGRKLHELAWGRDPRGVTLEREEKSVGHEITFEHDVTDVARLRSELLRQSDAVAVSLRRAGLVGRCVVLKLRYTDFSTVTRSRTLAEATNVGRRIYEEAAASFDVLAARGIRVRLIGVRVEQLGDGDGAGLGLWDPDDDWRGAELAVDSVTARFGRGSVRPASLLGPSQARPVGLDATKPNPRAGERGDANP